MATTERTVSPAPTTAPPRSLRSSSAWCEWRYRRWLHSLPPFAGCNRVSLARIAQWGDAIEVEAGEVLVREGQGDHWFFIVVSGEVELSRGGEQLGTLGPGTHFGERGAVGRGPQATTVMTTSRSTLFVLGAQYTISLLAT